MKTYAFGDIHGEYYKLTKLVSRLNITNDDLLVFLGDYIDRGEHSFEVIDYLCDLAKKYTCVFLRGNHELMLRDFMLGLDTDRLYTYNGGRTTIMSYDVHGYYIGEQESNIPETHMKFLQRLKPYYETDDFIFAHAGISPYKSMEEQTDDELYWDRDFNYEDYKGPKTVVYGHTPYNEVLNKTYQICIDTGACFKSMGDLTCVELPERIFTKQGQTKKEG